VPRDEARTVIGYEALAGPATGSLGQTLIEPCARPAGVLEVRL